MANRSRLPAYEQDTVESCGSKPFLEKVVRAKVHSEQGCDTIAGREGDAIYSKEGTR